MEMPGLTCLALLSGRATDPESAHSGFVLNVFDAIADFCLDLLLLTGETISRVASDVANRFLGFALQFLGASLDATRGGGQWQGCGADGEDSRGVGRSTQRRRGDQHQHAEGNAKASGGRLAQKTKMPIHGVGGEGETGLSDKKLWRPNHHSQFSIGTGCVFR